MRKFNLGTEDVDVARCLRRLGVYPNKSIDEFGRERFHPLSLFGHYHSKFEIFYLKFNEILFNLFNIRPDAEMDA